MLCSVSSVLLAAEFFFPWIQTKVQLPQRMTDDHKTILDRQEELTGLVAELSPESSVADNLKTVTTIQVQKVLTRICPLPFPRRHRLHSRSWCCPPEACVRTVAGQAQDARDHARAALPRRGGAGAADAVHVPLHRVPPGRSPDHAYCRNLMLHCQQTYRCCIADF